MNTPVKVLKVENCPTPGTLEFYNNKHCRFVCDKNGFIFNGIIDPMYSNNEYEIFGMRIIDSNTNVNRTEFDGVFLFARFPGKDTLIVFNDFSPRNLQNFRNTLVYTAYRSDKLKALCYIVSKAGCSTITNTFIKNDIDSSFDTTKDPWNRNTKWQRNKINTPYNQIEYTCKYDDYTKFLVFREPISRFLSLCNFAIDNRGGNLARPYTDAIADKVANKEQFINLMILLAKLNSLVSNGKLKDQHFSPQYDEIKSITKLNYVVMLPDLQKFFIEKFGVEANICNESKTKIFSKDDLKDYQIKRIKDIYREDFELLEKFTFYKPKNPEE